MALTKTCHLRRDGLEGRAGRGGRGGEVGKKAKGGNRVEMDGTASRVVADSRDESGTGAQPGTGNLCCQLLSGRVFKNVKKQFSPKTAVTTRISADMKCFVKLSCMELIC